MSAAEPIAEPGAGIGRAARPSWRVRATAGRSGPVLLILAVLVAVWYLGAVGLNWQTSHDRLARAGQPATAGAVLLDTWNAERPLLATPHQVAGELWRSIALVSPASPRSLLYHVRVTLSATLVGFLMGSLFGVLLAVLIVHSATLDKSLMPWVVASQTIPILAIAPMLIVVLNKVHLTGFLPKALISSYLSFFPVTVGMVKGLRSPDRLHLDLMRSYDAGRTAILGKLRLPAATPFLFASLKIAVAASLVGAIVGELPNSAEGGIGARLLQGSYYGQILQIWSALAVAAASAALLVGLVQLVERLVLRRFGAVR